MFLIAGLFTLVVALVLSGSILQVAPPIAGALALVGAFPGAAAMLIAAFGIAGRRRWAIAIATPLLILLLASAAIDFVVALTHGKFNLPFVALGSGWALRAPLRTAMGSGSWGVPGVVVFGALLVSTTWPVVSPMLLQPGGPFIVAKGALQPSLELTCNGAPDAAPGSVTIEYDWRWTNAEPWAAGNDSVTIEAYTFVDEGASGYALDVTGPTTAGVWESDIMIFEPKGMVFGIDLGAAGFEPGSVGMHLQQAGEPTSPHGSIDVKATYLHAPANTSGKDTSAAWRVHTEASCQW